MTRKIDSDERHAYEHGHKSGDGATSHLHEYRAGGNSYRQFHSGYAQNDHHHKHLQFDGDIYGSHDQHTRDHDYRRANGYNEEHDSRHSHSHSHNHSQSHRYDEAHEPRRGYRSDEDSQSRSRRRARGEEREGGISFGYLNESEPERGQKYEQRNSRWDSGEHGRQISGRSFEGQLTGGGDMTEAMKDATGKELWRSDPGLLQEGLLGCADAASKILRNGHASINGRHFGYTAGVTGIDAEARNAGAQPVSIEDAARSGKHYIAILPRKAHGHVGVGYGDTVTENSGGRYSAHVITHSLESSILRSGYAYELDS